MPSENKIERAKRILEQNGNDALKAIGVMLDENIKYRKRAQSIASTREIPEDKAQMLGTISDLQTKLEDSESNAIPAGAMILVGDEAKQYAALKELKVTPESFKKLTDDNATLTTTIAQGTAKELNTKAATAVGFNGDVLADLAAKNNLKIELRDVTVKDDKTGNTSVKPIPHVIGANNAATPLDVFITNDPILKQYLPALKTNVHANGTSTTGSGTPYPTQEGGRDAPAAGDAVSKFILDRNTAAAARPSAISKLQGTVPSPAAGK